MTNSSEQQLTLRLKSGETQTHDRKKILFCYRNPSAVELEDDFLRLPNLDEPNILHSLRVRYWAGEARSSMLCEKHDVVWLVAQLLCWTCLCGARA